MLHIISLLELESKDLKKIMYIIMVRFGLIQEYISFIRKKENKQNKLTIDFTSYLSQALNIKYNEKVNEDTYLNFEILIKRVLKHFKENILLIRENEAIFEKMQKFPSFVKLEDFYLLVRAYIKSIKYN